MDFYTYQQAAKTTAIFPKEQALPYLGLGLVGEAGEVGEKVKKVIRDDDGVVSEEKKNQIVKEIGDVLWYCAVLLDHLDVSMDDAAEMNLEKLFSRHRRGKLQGSGDDR